ncbi:hypothetical protein PspMM1_35910 [Pseudoalteromonas sp. MM1]|nr:hypothetical protein PspMM1_35910 [Pseudoalteromonas sp. MM1]
MSEYPYLFATGDMLIVREAPLPPKTMRFVGNSEVFELLTTESPRLEVLVSTSPTVKLIAFVVSSFVD